MKGLTKEQKKKLREKVKQNKFHTVYTCDKCKKKLKGIVEVRKHVIEKKHYSYSTDGLQGGLMFV